MHACSLARPDGFCDMVETGDVHSRAAMRTFIFACLPMTCLCGFCFALVVEEKQSCRPVGQPKSHLPLVLGLKRDLGRGYAIATLFHTANQPRPRPHCACLPAIVFTYLTHSLPLCFHVRLSPLLLLIASFFCVVASHRLLSSLQYQHLSCITPRQSPPPTCSPAETLIIATNSLS